MESTPAAPADVQAPSASPTTMSPWKRAIAIFTRPASAWVGLDKRSDWWFPVLLSILVVLGSTLAIYQRAIVPTQLEQMQRSVDAGRMTTEQVDRVESFMRGPAGMAFGLVPVVLLQPIFLLLVALLIWFGVGFVLGTKMRYRDAFAVAAWSSLVALPAQLLVTALAWFQETMKVHVGFGALVPVDDPPAKLQVFLASVLDAIGPFGVWYVVVVVLGASALSGAPRKSVAWVIAGLYLAMAVFASALGAMFTPGS